MTGWFLSTCALITALILLRLIFKSRMDPRLTYALWLLAALRVLIPVSLFQSPLSVDALAARTGADEAVETAEKFLAPKTFRHMTVDPPEDLSVDGVNAFVRDLQRDEMLYVYDVHSIGEDGIRLTAIAPVNAGTLWLMGGAAVFVVLAACNGRFARRLKKRRRLYEGALPVDCPLAVYVVEDLPSPCLFGFFRPAVYLNQTALDSGRLDHVLTHELTHCRHGDQWWAVLRCICLCVQWFNPLVWLAAYLSRQDCEAACDASAIKALGEDQRLRYGRTLVAMVAAGYAPAALFHTATTMTGGAKGLYRRVALIAKKPKMTVLTVLAVVLIAALAVGCTFGGAGDADASPAPGQAVQEAFEAISALLDEPYRGWFVQSYEEAPLP